MWRRAVPTIVPVCYGDCPGHFEPAIWRVEKGQRRKKNNHLIIWCILWGMAKAWRVRGGEARDRFQLPTFSILLWAGSSRDHGLYFWCCILNTVVRTWCINSVLLLGLKSVLPLSLRGGWFWMSYATSQFLPLLNGNNNRTNIMKVLWELNEIIHEMNFSQLLAWKWQTFNS